MDVEPEGAVEHRIGDEQAVRRDDHDVDVLDLRTLGLDDGHSQSLGDDLRGRRRHSPAAPGLGIGPRQQKGDLVTRR
jgi:hypothetical protein